MGTTTIRAAIAAALCMAATVRAAAYTVVDYWTGAYNSNWNVDGTGTAANWRYGADNKGKANYPNGTVNTKHAVFHPDYIQNYSVNVPGYHYSYKGNLAIGVGTEANPLVISATSASNGFSSNQSGMWFALGYPLSSYYPATDAVVKFSGGTYGPWQDGSYIGTSDGAHYGHLILDGQTIGTTLKFGKANANAFIMYSGRLTSTNANVVCNGNMRFAVANNATGIVDKVGGDWTFGSGTDTNGRLYLGHAPGTHAEFYHRGGTLTVSSWICIGAFQNTDTSKPGTGYAYFELDGGTVSNKTNNILICDKQGEPGDRAVVRIKSGTLAANTDMTIGSAYSGFLYMDGGELDVSRGKIKIAGGGANEDCALVMSNGVVKAQTIEHGSGTAALATILLDGGTLQASQSGTLMPGDDNLTFNVGPRGGTIDTNGKAIEIEERLVSTGATCGITVTGGGSLTASGAGDLAGAITIGDDTALRYFDQDGVVADYTLSSLSIGAGATIALDVDATGCDTFSAGTMNLTATAEKPVTVRLIVRSIPEAGRAFPIFAMAEADAANFNVTAETPVGATLEVVKGWSNGYLTYAILARGYVWNGANGALAVDVGTTVLTNGFNATLPSALADAATLWFAADANVIADENGGVTEWRDVREAANAETRLYKAALAYLPEEGEDGYEYRSELPVLTTTNVLPRANAKVVDFGSYGSGRWLYFAAPGGTNLTHVTIGSFFTVVGFDATCGHILGDVTALATGKSGTMFFHKGAGTSIGGNIANEGADNNTMYLGETRLNGTRIDPRIVAYNYNAFQLFSQNGPDRTTRGTPYASTFFNNCNFKPTNGGTLVRQGGGELAEFIAFDRVLSDAERREVEAYLAAKYFGVPMAGRVAVADGATLATGFDVLTDTSYHAAVLSDSCGAGTIRKTGDGTLRLDRPVSIDATRLDLEEGRFEMGQVHLSPFVAPCVNRKYQIGTWLWVNLGTRTDGFLSVEGSGTALDASASFYPGDWAGRAILVKDMTGTIRNLPEPYTPPATGIAETNLLVNGGFEEPVITSSLGYVQGSDAQPTGWELNNTSDSNALSLYGKAWRTTTDDRVEGNQVFALTGKGSEYADIQQRFTAPFDGLYHLTFWAGRRENRKETEGQLRMLVFLDGEQVGLHVNCADHRGNRNAMRQFSLKMPPLAAGSHVIRFILDGNVTTDRSVILDDVRLVPVAKGEFVSVPNAGFESVEMVGTPGNTGYFKWTPTEAEWTFVSTSGICGHSTWFSCLRSRPAPGEELEDLHKAFLNNNATISTTVTAPRDGQVVFTMRYGNRANYDWQAEVGTTRATGQTCRVLLDGAEIGSVQPTCEAMRTFMSAPFAVTAGEHTLTIEHEGVSGKDVATVVDDIRIGYDTTAYAAKGETLSASVTAPSNGFYRLDVPAIGAELQLGHVNGSNNGVSHYPVTAYVYLDGALTSKIRLERPEWTTFALVLPYLTAGAHTLAFTVSSNGAETGTDGRFRVGKLDLQPLAFRETAPANAMKDTTIRLDAGGKLDLQFEGVMRLGKLVIDGAPVFGDFGAASDPTRFSGPGVLRVLPKGTLILVR